MASEPDTDHSDLAKAARVIHREYGGPGIMLKMADEIERLRGVIGMARYRLSRAADACADGDLSDPRIDQLSQFAIEIESMEG